MNTDTRWLQRLGNYAKAVARLEEGIALSRVRALSCLEKQGLIKAFEFTFELAWNVMKDYLTAAGVTDIIGSRGAIRQAFSNGLIENGDVWMDMVESRNLSSHTYDEPDMDALLDTVRDVYGDAFSRFLDTMRRRSEDMP